MSVRSEILHDIRTKNIRHNTCSCGPHSSVLRNFLKLTNAVWLHTCDVKHGKNGTYLHSYTFHLYKGVSKHKFLEHSYFGGLLVSKKIRKFHGSKSAFEQETFVYILQNEKMVIFLEVLKRVNFSWDTRHIFESIKEGCLEVFTMGLPRKIIDYNTKLLRKR